MAITRTKKEGVVAKIKDAVAQARTVVFVRFHGVTAKEIDELRVACAAENVGYVVAKKTLIRKALQDTDIDGSLEELSGEVAVAYGDDLLTPVRLMGEQSKKLEDRITIIGGIFEQSFTSAERMQSIAAIPPLKTLFAQFLMVIRSPIQGCAVALSEIADKRDS